MEKQNKDGEENGLTLVKCKGYRRCGYTENFHRQIYAVDTYFALVSLIEKLS